METADGGYSCGAEMIYVAMFDEIDEGTAIFKCAKKVPVGESLFVPLEEEVESDHYLKLVGEAGKVLRKEKAVAFDASLNPVAPNPFIRLCIQLTLPHMYGQTGGCMYMLHMILLLHVAVT